VVKKCRLGKFTSGSVFEVQRSRDKITGVSDMVGVLTCPRNQSLSLSGLPVGYPAG